MVMYIHMYNIQYTYVLEFNQKPIKLFFPDRFTFVPVGISFGIFICGTIFIWSIKIKNWLKDHQNMPQISESLANVQEVNQPNQNEEGESNIIGAISLIIFGVIIIITFLPLILLQTESIHFVTPLPSYIIFIFPSIILPCLYFIVNRNCLPSVVNFFF